MSAEKQIIKGNGKIKLWINTLQIGDKLDVCARNFNKWHIGTILSRSETSIKIHHDGWENDYDEWINLNIVNNGRAFSTMFQKLNTFTSFHNYLKYSHYDECQACKLAKNKRKDHICCSQCKKDCCKLCALDLLHMRCNDCFILNNISTMSDSIQSAVINNKIFKIDIHIITIIAEYSIGSLLQCNNKLCQSEIYIRNDFDLAHCIDDCGGKIYKNISKIFCATCTKNLFNCRLCPRKDITQICDNHPFCSVCSKKTYTYCMKKCERCNTDVCKSCIYNKVCSNCIVTAERKTISDLLLSTVIADLFRVKIIGVISDYAMGYIVKCCNFAVCKTEIIIQNKFAFYRKYDYNHHKIFHYIADNADINIHTINIYNASRRIFCSICALHLIKCRFNWSGCKNRDLESSYTHMPYGGTYICAKHPICVLCDRRAAASYNIAKCTLCSNYVCNRCNKFFRKLEKCKNCYVIEELTVIIKRIDDVIHAWVNIDCIKIIGEYAIGFAVDCCNDNCENEIVANSQCELKNSVNYKGNKICLYNPKKHTNTIILYNTHYRIFCAECSQSKLKKCGAAICDNKDINRYCQEHPPCFICHERKNKKFLNDKMNDCKICHQYCCVDCYIEDNEIIICKHCCISKERKLLCDAIKFAVIKYYIKDDKSINIIKISDIIYQFSVGYVVICVKDDCLQRIMVDNRFDFKQCIDTEKSRFYHYCPKQRTDTIYVCGEQRRVFCRICNRKCLRKCAHVGCNNRDVDLIHTMTKDDDYYVCNEHPYCEICNFRSRYSAQNILRCIICDKQCCSVCQRKKICKNCVIDEERKLIQCSIKNGLVWDFEIMQNENRNCIEIISLYCIGYILNCSNTLGCNNEIIIKNKFDYKCRVDYEGKKIYKYSPKYCNDKDIVIVYNKEIRIFCSNCKSNVLQRCIHSSGCKNKEIEPVCFSHPICSMCKKRPKSDNQIKACSKYEFKCNACC